ncbi:hypothetical protein VW35_00920 [Devosia soli]|uniref:DNA binding HTH domain-containing protein n=1 Tax=Devosia soli TaxID=361041 RepID=A0A0F5LEL7_9HYPH|nr:helix-turn-helix domain-containing protein [Devosia soli]KKB80803.1 hypothetical protein VW35_00920 [Devosia soli]
MKPLSHLEQLQAGIASMNMPPQAVQFHYARAVLAAEKGSISAAARRMGIHRRTLQRMMEKNAPKPRVDK